eukprot:TRINITY_DN24374_c0_g1_i13.p1 TRINITY_DN24374_c0_g1~~TRINITY_DN24374_c0_g1_i13.p1  ORF type:complete len:377 (-),score=-5.76 TRINITY_DN24374_c0_g1_i13:49-1179(-)
MIFQFIDRSIFFLLEFVYCKNLQQGFKIVQYNQIQICQLVYWGKVSFPNLKILFFGLCKKGVIVYIEYPRNVFLFFPYDFQNKQLNLMITLFDLLKNKDRKIHLVGQLELLFLTMILLEPNKQIMKVFTSCILLTVHLFKDECNQYIVTYNLNRRIYNEIIIYLLQFLYQNYICKVCKNCISMVKQCILIEAYRNSSILTNLKIDILAYLKQVFLILLGCIISKLVTNKLQAILLRKNEWFFVFSQLQYNLLLVLETFNQVSSSLIEFPTSQLGNILWLSDCKLFFGILLVNQFFLFLVANKQFFLRDLEAKKIGQLLQNLQRRDFFGGECLFIELVNLLYEELSLQKLSVGEVDLIVQHYVSIFYICIFYLMQLA